jgi:hypothetical protein
MIVVVDEYDFYIDGCQGTGTDGTGVRLGRETMWDCQTGGLAPVTSLQTHGLTQMGLYLINCPVIYYLRRWRLCKFQRNLNAS